MVNLVPVAARRGIAAVLLCVTLGAVPGNAGAAQPAALPRLSPEAVRAAVNAPLIRFNRNISGGAHTNGAWFGGASVALAVAAYAGDTSADARLLQQMRYNITSGNDISANGGYPAQHERHVTAMYAIAKLTPRIWNSLTSEEKSRIDLLMKAAFVASAFTTSDNNPYIRQNSQQYAIDGDSNLNRGWNPNYREGMVGGVLVGMVYFGGAAAAGAILDSYDHAEFVANLQRAELTNIHETFTWKERNPSSVAPDGATIKAGIAGYRYFGLALSDYAAIYERLLNNTFGKSVHCGLNGGAGIGGAGRIVSGCEGLPNKGQPGMLLEFDSSDANGARSSASYAYDGYRPHLSNFLVLYVGGYLRSYPDTLARAATRLNVGVTDLWYKIEQGYIGYAKGKSQGVFGPENASDWGFAYNRAVWEDVVKPILNGDGGGGGKQPAPPGNLTVQ